MSRRTQSVSDTELIILKALWEVGPSTVRGLNARLEREGHEWAYTTVQTLLGRLREKGFVETDRSGVAHVYRALRSRDELLGQQLSSLADRLCDGARTPLVLNLVEGAGFSPQDIERFRQLLDRLDTQPEDDAGSEEGHPHS